MRKEKRLVALLLVSHGAVKDRRNQRPVRWRRVKTFASPLKWTEERNGEGKGRETCFTSPSQQMLFTVQKNKNTLHQDFTGWASPSGYKPLLEHSQLSAAWRRFCRNCGNPDRYCLLLFTPFCYYFRLNIKTHLDTCCCFSCEGVWIHPNISPPRCM